MSKRYETVGTLADRLRVKRQTVHAWLRRSRWDKSAIPAWATDEMGRRYWTEAAVLEWEAARPPKTIEHEED